MSNREQQLKLHEIKLSEIVVSGTTNFVKNRPVTVSVWVLGLALAAFANGFAVSDLQEEAYSIAKQQAQEVESGEYASALRNFRRAEDAYYNAKGWFSCDAKCQRAKDKMAFAQQEVDRVAAKRDSFMTEARREVGIWSVYGVKEIREVFWGAWQSGKDMAARWTMWDAMFAMFRSREEDSLLASILQLVVQYVINLTIGLAGAMFYFAYSAYQLIVAYGEPAMSGLAFFLLVMVSGMALVGTYLMAITGTVAGGGFLLLQQASKQALENERNGGRPPPRRMQNQGYHRSHYE
mmetsp:Transcript_73947/g.154121  ORF Transcript_73947/g.154121 Transcript_73947/m.154121 type:complete len:293 (+) Transcript_73947:87-965(+)|eukprot:CAMPEP_0206459020 /NCGR_PEP_ID=MMETSP0324_2-20121206/23927_1 /ASSEMBLY_ACC=CAM_ASM_000836 /TAXON_ID=2866 /ORGANISM="Crypthecodinium cohnii, Strain Seligo" /LENGTH=292 /DNA_ID=CAMNT_0053930491 /DNA_START=70 /DNA_END=948 /DNA_ORIENTATION=+